VAVQREIEERAARLSTRFEAERQPIDVAQAAGSTIAPTAQTDEEERWQSSTPHPQPG
jgi:hypothetical protein